jgi:hypothetical protein
MLATAMASIEAETSIAAAPGEVWAALLDGKRWTSRAGLVDPTGPATKRRRVTLDAVEPLDGPADQVGTLRWAAATITIPLLGARAAQWVEQVSDIAPPWTIEYEALARRPFKRWRLRLRLAERRDGGTRVRCRLTYAPATLAFRVADLLFLRRAIAHQVQATLDGLARAFAPAPEPTHPSAAPEGAGDTPHAAVPV